MRRYSLITLSFVCHECQRLTEVKVRPRTEPVKVLVPGDHRDRILAALDREDPTVKGVRLSVERCPHTTVLEARE